MEMLEKLSKLKKRHNELSKMLADSEILKDPDVYKKVTREYRGLSEIIVKFDKYEKIVDQIREDEQILSSEDAELREIAKVEIDELKEKKEQLEEELKLMLIPRDPDDEKDIIMEIRAGTGGEEAALFAADLYRMYQKYAEQQNWKVDVLSSNPTGIGGFKEIIFSVSGENVYSKLKFERGVHRVQRVPITESSGRIHTSAASVAVLPEVREIEFEIDPRELRVDVFRSSGPGGQSVNTTDSAVRITHIPTGIVVTCQDEKSQHKNKVKAMKVLRARLLNKIKCEQEAVIAEERKNQIGTGDRSAKIRTYNFPQNRITDHRINFSLHKLEDVLEGNLEELIEKLQISDRIQKLESMEISA